MKTNFSNYLAAASFTFISVLAACTSNTKTASEMADSANKEQISKTDSANKMNVSTSDSVNKANKVLKEDASKFLVKAYESGLFEIELSKLAATNGLSPEVKSLAAKLVTAHTGINSKMEQIALGANFKLPGDIDNDHAKTLQDAANLKNADFDKKYMEAIVSGHEKSESTYKDAYKNLSEGTTKTFAAETLPLIQEHLAMAKKVKAGIK